MSLRGCPVLFVSTSPLMVQVPGFSYAMARKLGQWKLSTMSFAKIGMSFSMSISWKLTIGLFFCASVSGSSIRLCLIKMAMNFCLIGLAQLAVGRICPGLQEFNFRLRHVFKMLALE